MMQSREMRVGGLDMSKQIETSLKTFFRDKIILVTGGTGSIGRQIVKKLTACSPKKVIVFSKDDSKQYMMKNEYAANPEVVFALGDVRDASRVRRLVKGVDIIFHAPHSNKYPPAKIIRLKLSKPTSSADSMSLKRHLNMKLVMLSTFQPTKRFLRQMPWELQN